LIILEIFRNPKPMAGVHRVGGRNKMREPVIAGILSLLIPGLGQIYNGRIVIGLVWLLLTGFSWIGSAGMLGWVVHLIAGWCAYSYAKDNPIRH
jgi:TM2 domain-containing membrane protein YozV